MYHKLALLCSKWESQLFWQKMHRPTFTHEPCEHWIFSASAISRVHWLGDMYITELISNYKKHWNSLAQYWKRRQTYSVDFHEKLRGHGVYWNGISSCRVRWCQFRLPDRNRLSPVWTRMWTFSADLAKNFLGHWNGFSTVWLHTWLSEVFVEKLHTWLFSVHFKENFWGHEGHWNGFLTVWIRTWFFSMVLSEKLPGHERH